MGDKADPGRNGHVFGPRTRRATLLATDSWNLIRRDGASTLAGRILRAAYLRWGPSELSFPLMPGDVMSSGNLKPAAANVPRDPDRPLRVGWITVPPGPGSGGHTTMFRMIEALEQAGHTCVLHLYDRYQGDLRRREEVVRSCWPQIRAEVRDIHDGVNGIDALVATSWATAHVAARYCGDVRRCFYFVQDYEPYFYPRGAEYVLAEDTFSFGFHGLAAGRWLSRLLGEQFGMSCDAFEFGADKTIYRNTGLERDGVVFYAKPQVARRGYQLGVEVLREFSRRFPDAPVHLFGERVHELPFAASTHGTLCPTELNVLYNTCRVGLSLSFTNVSLIPWELLSSGVVPVVNDAEHNRVVLHSDSVQWANPTVTELADGMSEAYENYSAEVAKACAASVEMASWDDAGHAIVAVIERETP